MPVNRFWRRTDEEIIRLTLSKCKTFAKLTIKVEKNRDMKNLFIISIF